MSNYRRDELDRIQIAKELGYETNFPEFTGKYETDMDQWVRLSKLEEELMDNVDHDMIRLFGVQVEEKKGKRFGIINYRSVKDIPKENLFYTTQEIDEKLKGAGLSINNEDVIKDRVWFHLKRKTFATVVYKFEKLSKSEEDIKYLFKKYIHKDPID